ncbi:MAG: DUF6528 family protein [Verrucomicrobiota bacterium]|nr:DUF6528 family protein [Verrucomicrobiota bacterium]
MQLPLLFICGDTLAEQYALTESQSVPQPLWQWDSRTAPGLPDERRELFFSLDEVKPVMIDRESCLLVTSSWRGGGAVIRRSDGRVLFSAAVTNAHSIELLPGGWLVIAGSDGCDELQLYHLTDGPSASKPHAVVPLPHGHGVVWDGERQQLWACGAREVARFSFHAESHPKLERLATLRLPDDGAHDLMPNPHTGELLVTTKQSVWRIDPRTDNVSSFEPLAGMLNVKAVSVEAQSGTIAFQLPDGQQWWSERVLFLLPNGNLRQIALWNEKPRKVYKVRWDQPCQMK